MNHVDEARLAFARVDSATTAVVDRAYAALGGARLDAVRIVRLRGWQRRAMIEQSIRPEGPYYDDQSSFDETLDLSTGVVHRELGHSGYGASAWFLDQTEPTRDVLDGTLANPRDSYDGAPPRASAKDAQELQEERALGPLGIIATARNAADLHALPPVAVNGFAHTAVGFTWLGHAVTLIVNPGDGLPTEVRFTAARPYDVFWNVWGDVRERIRFEAWNSEPSGFRYPRQITTERNGLPDTTRMISSLETLPVFPSPAPLQSPAPTRTVDEIPFVCESKNRIDIARDVTLCSGAWNVSFARTSLGMMMLEMPISAAYVEGALRYFATAYPHEKLAGVISTSDSWPHVGGVRAVVAHGIPIYAFGLTRPLLERLVRAPHTERPDALSAHSRAMLFHPIDARMTLGRGDESLVLAPYATVTGERQVMVWRPAAHALYTSDLFAYDPQQTFTPGTLDEAIGAAARERFVPTTAWGMHYGATPWTTLVAAGTHPPAA